MGQYLTGEGKKSSNNTTLCNGLLFVVVWEIMNRYLEIEREQTITKIELLYWYALFSVHFNPCVNLAIKCSREINWLLYLPTENYLTNWDNVLFYKTNIWFTMWKIFKHKTIYLMYNRYLCFLWTQFTQNNCWYQNNRWNPCFSIRYPRLIYKILFSAINVQIILTEFYFILSIDRVRSA